MKNKILATTIGVIVISLSLLVVGCKKTENAENKFKIGFTNNDDANLFAKTQRDLFAATMKSDPTFEVVFTNGASDSQLQLDQIDNFIVQKVNAIVIRAVDYAGIVPGIEKANKANIPVISLGLDAGGGDFIWIGSKNYEAGKMQGEWLVENLPANAKILYLSCVPGFTYSIERQEGLYDTLKTRSDITILAEQTGNDQRIRGMQIMEDWLQSFPQFDAVVAANDEMILGAIEALKGANKLTSVITAGVDATNDACIAVKNGELTFTVFQNSPALVVAAYDVCKRLQNGERIEKEIIVPFELVTIENVDEYL
ncbi:MAG: sugar ABC transporter substrate-binding protein [Syntrophomonadaceae bacterium]|jgi:inositol transport system substrate-binding protein|nr:sugar ABC transporter substrate-binding protein [Syntrophomonadaceae bacterium]